MKHSHRNRGLIVTGLLLILPLGGLFFVGVRSTAAPKPVAVQAVPAQPVEAQNQPVSQDE